MATKMRLAKGNEELILVLEKLSGADADKIAKKALFEGADIVTNRVRANLWGTLSGEGTGDLFKSLGISSMRKNDSGWDVKIGFAGYDKHGTANQLKARILESGTTKQPKRPFFRPAVNSTREAAKARIAEVIDREIGKIGG
jgi:phage protein, HK97 gp10 family